MPCRLKTPQKHHDSLDPKDFERLAEFRGEGYQVEWTCKECSMIVTEYYPYTGYMIRDKDRNDLEESWN